MNYKMKRDLTLAVFLLLTFISYSQTPDSLKLRGIKDSIKVLTPLDSVLAKKDSLLRPFYFIEFDSLTMRRVYKPRFRMSISPLNQDTIYVPVPKAKTYIATKKKLNIDTLRILNPIAPASIDTTKFAEAPVWWQNTNSIGLDLTEATFVNWNAGGNNSISGLLSLTLTRKYKKLLLLWSNELKVRYGLNSQEDRGLRKTDDQIRLNSTFGYRKDTVSNWYYSVKMNFNTQFTNGFSYPDTETPISRFFAPAYLFLGAGAQYDLKEEKFFIYLSPITLKSTFVIDQALSDSGAFGLAPGNKARHEFGILVQHSYTKEIIKNIVMNNELSLYSDYLRDFGNIDIAWDLNFEFTVNKYIKANLGGYLIYDNDIKFKDDIDGDGNLETLGARVQLKQLLSIGFKYSF